MKMLVESWKFRCQPQCFANFNVTNTVKLVAQFKKHKTKYTCIVEANGSMRKRMEECPHKNHEDHIAGKGMNSLNHYNLVRKFIPVPQAMRKPDAKAAVEKEWEKLEKICSSPSP